MISRVEKGDVLGWNLSYVVSDTDPDVGDGTRRTMAVTLTASDT